ncbi:hypothetical protein QTN47_04610 [Danxiaibacter flavus]|uniref:Uncharacterized protein n=1 Tax=Danxiaibacter flavus TaxID=3049108 RepID=A0ABV3ZA75_9BACT|nr:hypothetical protein QNM32_04610 [Chitinophagaceae bacterium DXS]
MLRVIAFLRIVGVVCLMVFIGCKILGYHQVANYVIRVTLVSFSVIIALQLYYRYIRDYFGKKDVDADECNVS